MTGAQLTSLKLTFELLLQLNISRSKTEKVENKELVRLVLLVHTRGISFQTAAPEHGRFYCECQHL